MKKSILSIITIFFLAGCDEEKQPQQSYDAVALTQQKCATCHDLSMPADSNADEKAPPMMAVVFHLKDFIKVNVPSAHQGKFVEFVDDYVMNPTLSKSYCDKDSLEKYGLMPSQKGNITPDELNAVSKYLYSHYDAQRFYRERAEETRVKNMPIHERILEQKRCKNCHELEKDKVAPSFQNIAKRYTREDKKTLIHSLSSGSRGRWEKSRIPMPAYSKLTPEELDGMVDWILSLK
ncbi:MAG: cytochrome c [Campylobacterota bacterium]|nr:cytochrome c [Campylobacterota bacterium]